MPLCRRRMPKKPFRKKKNRKRTTKQRQLTGETTQWATIGSRPTKVGRRPQSCTAPPQKGNPQKWPPEQAAKRSLQTTTILPATRTACPFCGVCRTKKISFRRKRISVLPIQTLPADQTFRLIGSRGMTGQYTSSAITGWNTGSQSLWTEVPWRNHGVRLERHLKKTKEGLFQLGLK